MITNAAILSAVRGETYLASDGSEFILNEWMDGSKTVTIVENRRLGRYHKLAKGEESEFYLSYMSAVHEARPIGEVLTPAGDHDAPFSHWAPRKNA